MIGQLSFKADQAETFKDIYSITSRFSQVSQWFSSISKNLIIYSFCLLDVVENDAILDIFSTVDKALFCYVRWCLVLEN